MSGESEEKALQQGHECAMSALVAEREMITSLVPADQLHWWLGFLAAAMGAALASVGEPAFRALQSALGEEEGPKTISARRERAASETSVRKKETYIKGSQTRSKKKT